MAKATLLEKARWSCHMRSRCQHILVPLSLTLAHLAEVARWRHVDAQYLQTTARLACCAEQHLNFQADGDPFGEVLEGPLWLL